MELAVRHGGQRFSGTKRNKIFHLSFDIFHLSFIPEGVTKSLAQIVVQPGSRLSIAHCNDKWKIFCPTPDLWWLTLLCTPSPHLLWKKPRDSSLTALAW